MKQMYDVPEKVVVMELEQLSLNDVQQSIEERQKKKTSYTIEKRAAKKYCKLRVVASKRKVKNGTTPELQRNIGRKSYCATLVHCKRLDEFHPKRKLAAALYSRTTVELYMSPLNLGKAFSFAESAEENIHCCPNQIAALARKPMTGMLINENKIKTNCVQSKM